MVLGGTTGGAGRMYKTTSNGCANGNYGAKGPTDAERAPGKKGPSSLLSAAVIEGDDKSGLLATANLLHPLFPSW